MSAATTDAPPAATAAATSAASGIDSKTKAMSIQTPVSASYPSELRSPHPGNHSFLKRDESIKTPITPPAAYADFLKNLSPAMITPPTTSGSSRFPSSDVNRYSPASATGSEEPGERANYTGSYPEPALHAHSKSPPPLLRAGPQHPILSRNTSTDSTMTTTSASTTASTLSTCSSGSTDSLNSATRIRPESPRIIIPPSPFAKPHPTSARTPRRLYVPPPSPFSAASPSSARSLQSLQSPYSTSALSQTPWSASFSPRGSFAPQSSSALVPKTNPPGPSRPHPKDEATAPPTKRPNTSNDPVPDDRSRREGKVCVRQTLTRTVMYCRSSRDSQAPTMDPAPKGKRRRVDTPERERERLTADSQDADAVRNADAKHENATATRQRSSPASSQSRSPPPSASSPRYESKADRLDHDDAIEGMSVASDSDAGVGSRLTDSMDLDIGGKIKNPGSGSDACITVHGDGQKEEEKQRHGFV